jgi:hypothetical protein
MTDAAKSKDVKVRPLTVGNKSHPYIIVKGAKPAKGTNYEFDADNGVTYTGKVTDSTEASDGTMIEFADGLKVVPAK